MSDNAAMCWMLILQRGIWLTYYVTSLHGTQTWRVKADVNFKPECYTLYNVNHKTPAFLVRFLKFFYLIILERNILQYTYLMAWWRHKSVTMRVTKVYFVQLFSKTMLSLKIGLKNLFKKTCGNVKVFLPKDWYKNFLPKIGKYEHWTTFCESCEQPVRSSALWCLT